MNDPTAYQTGEKELVFVYNARSDLFSKITDFAHKIISPATYSCSLCSLTHGSLGMHGEWATFIQSLPYQISFLYKDQVEAHPKVDLPQVWLRDGAHKKVLIEAAELKAMPSLEALIELIMERLKQK
jgi:hypothetical protein